MSPPVLAERFMTSGKPPAISDTEDFAFTTFGAGARFCIGKYLSEMEMKAVLAMLLRRHRLELVGDKLPALRVAIPMLKINEGFELRVVVRGE